MNITNRRKNNSKTLDRNDNYILKKNHFSKSQKTLDLVPRNLNKNYNYPKEESELSNLSINTDNYKRIMILF